MREIEFNGYIDEDVIFGDEVTPEMLHGMLYGSEGSMSDDVHIRLNSYGGSCNAATRMFDDIRTYPGKVKITVSGTAASAATVVCMAADQLEMTLGSLFMIHDPSTVAFGNEQSMQEAIEVLRAAKESILNMYGIRARVTRSDAADMMKKTTWMDANEAFEKGFVDGVQEIGSKGLIDSVEHKVALDAAKAGVQAWFDRKAKPYAAVRSENQRTDAAADCAEENNHGEEHDGGQAVTEESPEATQEGGQVSTHDPSTDEAGQTSDSEAQHAEMHACASDQASVTEEPRIKAADLMKRLSLLK